jgi:hypothetical protein
MAVPLYTFSSRTSEAGSKVKPPPSVSFIRERSASTVLFCCRFS